MIEIFETCQTKSIAKQTNREESLIFRSIVQVDRLEGLGGRLLFPTVQR